jgi:hypothetical protein
MSEKITDVEIDVFVIGHLPLTSEATITHIPVV